ncbi:MAG: alpha-amylase family glycosyl hydrolase [Paracoccaceae bacterium]
MDFALQTSKVIDPADKDWWRGAVIYQIYPRSFQDSNGDGIGDLAGIIARLPYVASLGVDAIWISPFFTSPMQDFGYDIADYRDVDPMFGTLPIFDQLVRAAHDLGLHVMIDLVLSHTSDQHPWFAESRADKDNPRADWYVWADPKPDGTPPNNWLSIFGGSAWEWDGSRHQYYMHNFLRSQPDLNFHTDAVQDALLDVARFWLERGVDGFRFDTINFFFCDKALRDNPALPKAQRNASIAPDVNPYNFQDHIYDKNRPENLAFLRKMRALMDEYPAIAAVGEVGDAQYGMEIMGQYTAGDELMHMCYAFEFLSHTPLDRDYVSGVQKQYAELAPDGWACWAFSNHDVMRHASRWALDDVGKKLTATLLMSLRGSVCLYQGEELGLDEAEVAFKDLQDPYGLQFWPQFKGRDGCRTPMVWTPTQPNGEFSTGKPWLPVAPKHLTKAVSAQENNSLSLLAHYRRMISFRKSHTALRKGELTLIDSNTEALTFLRTHHDKTLFCAFNMGKQALDLTLPKGGWHVLEGLEFTARLEGGNLHLPVGQAFFAQQI